MSGPTQRDVIAFLGSAAGHPGGGPVDIVETHGAIIFLAGDVALKIKRDVTYDYMDLSTLALREAMLRRELDLNRPIAPEIYQDVVPVTCEPDGSLTFDGGGDPVEWVLRMWRFPTEAELAVIAERTGINDDLAHDLGTAVFQFHVQAPIKHNQGSALIGDILDELDRVFAGMRDALGQDRIEAFARTSRAEWQRVAEILDQRAKNGHVRRGHGDLHLRNLVLLDGTPVPFDALEFDEVLGTCDVLYDLAFLLMDLHQRGLDRAANIALASYLLAARGAEDSGLATLPLFLAVRAAIRAMVAVQTSAATHVSPGEKPRRILNNAMAFLSPACPQLVLIGGISGTGKTTIAKAVASRIGAPPGAVHLRTDLERKAVLGMEKTVHAPEAVYDPAGRRRVYARVFDRAATILSAGHPVLIDATFLDPKTRRKAKDLAARCNVALVPIWLDAPLDVLLKRVSSRAADASDADEYVVRKQHANLDVPKDWKIICSDGTLEDTTELVRNALKLSIRHQKRTP